MSVVAPRYLHTLLSFLFICIPYLHNISTRHFSFSLHVHCTFTTFQHSAALFFHYACPQNFTTLTRHFPPHLMSAYPQNIPSFLHVHDIFTIDPPSTFRPRMYVYSIITIFPPGTFFNRFMLGMSTKNARVLSLLFPFTWQSCGNVFL
jgi:hypothetical protein